MNHRHQAIRLKTAKGRPISSTKWLNRQLNDPYVERSKREGYVSRAAYKLLEIDSKFNLLDKDMTVVDLGASPGSWTQILDRLGIKNIIAVDLKPLEIATNACFIQGDFREVSVVNAVLSQLNERKVHVVLSDMAHNSTGNKTLDHTCIIALCEAAFEFAKGVLVNGGTLVVKVIQGGEETKLVNQMKKHFGSVKFFKPQASRKDSSEIYIVASHYGQAKG